MDGINELDLLTLKDEFKLKLECASDNAANSVSAAETIYNISWCLT